MEYILGMAIIFVAWYNFSMVLAQMEMSSTDKNINSQTEDIGGKVKNKKIFLT